MEAKDLRKHPIHLGLEATARSEPEFDGMAWYADYAKRHEADGREGRLVSIHQFTTSWDSWEMHPEGAEVVLCIEGELTLVQEIGGGEKRTALRAGEYAINEAGVWHSADVGARATALFITAGLGTQHRPR